MKDCSNNRIFRKCKFEARYDISKPDLSQMRNYRGYELLELFEKLRSKTYVHDICVRCGKVVKRD